MPGARLSYANRLWWMRSLLLLVVLLFLPPPPPSRWTIRGLLRATRRHSVVASRTSGLLWGIRANISAF